MLEQDIVSSYYKRSYVDIEKNINSNNSPATTKTTPHTLLHGFMPHHIICMW